MTSSDVIDSTALDQILQDAGGDADFVAEIIDDFLANTRVLLDEVAASLESGNAGGARNAAHTLKGTSGSLGARSLSAIAAEAESGSLAGNLDQLAALLPRLEAEFAVVSEQLKREQARFRAEP